MDETIVQLKQLIRREMNDLADMLASGGAQDFEGYRYATGTIKGLAWVEEQIDELMKPRDREDGA